MENRLEALLHRNRQHRRTRTFTVPRRNEAAAKFWLESDAAAAICEELATFDYLYLSGISLAILSPTSRGAALAAARMPTNGGKVISVTTTARACGPSREETQQVYQQMLQCTDIAFLARMTMKTPCGVSR